MMSKHPQVKNRVAGGEVHGKMPRDEMDNNLDEMIYEMIEDLMHLHDYLSVLDKMVVGDHYARGGAVDDQTYAAYSIIVDRLCETARNLKDRRTALAACLRDRTAK